MGKRKIVMEKIGDRQKRSVTFTKRRDGLFKKAETACQKFGLQIGIVVFSPAGKPFTFCNSSSVSVDAIIDTYISDSSLPSSSAVMVGKRSRSDGDDVQVIETEKKKKRKKMMNDDVVTPPCITIQEEEEDEKLDEGFHWDQTNDQELTNEFMGSGENAGIVTEEMLMESSQVLVEGDCYSTWAPPDVELQEIINLDDFEYSDQHHHCDDKIMGFLPPTHSTTTSLCNSMSAASDMNEEEVGGSNEDDGYTLEEWEHIFSTRPTSVVDSTVVGNSYMNQLVPADNWPTQEEFVQLLCS